jgi:hypothetical protein
MQNRFFILIASLFFCLASISQAAEGFNQERTIETMRVFSAEVEKFRVSNVETPEKLLALFIASAAIFVRIYDKSTVPYSIDWQTGLEIDCPYTIARKLVWGLARHLCAPEALRDMSSHSGKDLAASYYAWKEKWPEFDPIARHYSAYDAAYETASSVGILENNWGTPIQAGYHAVLNKLPEGKNLFGSIAGILRITRQFEYLSPEAWRYLPWLKMFLFDHENERIAYENQDNLGSLVRTQYSDLSWASSSAHFSKNSK